MEPDPRNIDISTQTFQYLLSASVNNFRRCLVLVTKFVNLVMKTFDH